MCHTPHLQFLQAWKSNSLFWKWMGCSCCSSSYVFLCSEQKRNKGYGNIAPDQSEEMELVSLRERGGWGKGMEVARWGWQQLEGARARGDRRAGGNLPLVCSPHAEMTWYYSTPMCASNPSSRQTSGLRERRSSHLWGYVRCKDGPSACCPFLDLLSYSFLVTFHAKFGHKWVFMPCFAVGGGQRKSHFPSAAARPFTTSGSQRSLASHVPPLPCS